MNAFSDIGFKDISPSKNGIPTAALIAGITGQVKSYLAKFVLAKGYDVRGIKRRSSSFNTDRLNHIYQDQHFADPNLFLHYGDLTDKSNLTCILQQVQPDEVYNLGAMNVDPYLTKISA